MEMRLEMRSDSGFRSALTFIDSRRSSANPVPCASWQWRCERIADLDQPMIRAVEVDDGNWTPR